eukprot:9159276-Pyramimonas_sp.AAC.1
MSHKRHPHGSERKHTESPCWLTSGTFVSTPSWSGVGKNLNALNGCIHGKGNETGEGLDGRRVSILGPTQDVSRKLHGPVPV